MDHILRPTFTEVYDEKIRQELKNNFSRVNNECYLDHVGAALYSDVQMKKICDDLMSSLYGNPHLTAGAGNQSYEIIERTRYRILDFFHASSDEYSLVFTSGATASLKCIAETFNFNKSGDELNDGTGYFVHLQDNHTSVLGMRDVVIHKGAKVVCFDYDDAFSIFSRGNLSSDNCPTYRNNSLFVYPAESNFSGFKYPLDWIEDVHKGVLNNVMDSKSNWYVLLDAASYVGTNVLDLSTYKPDFIVLSFYKMFGYPTGIGALIVKNSSINALDKIYYGGGTVNIVLSKTNYHVKRDTLHQRYEDGTASFLSIISLQHGLDALTTISMDKISHHTFSLAQYLHHSLMTLHHHNDRPVIKIYADSDYEDRSVQGAIVAFNVLRSNGEYVGYMEVLHMASIFKIHLRVGCFCNPGACQRQLNLSNEDIMNNYDAGFTCGGGKDLIDGRPTGAVRISFGYMSTADNVQTLLKMIRNCFLDGPVMIKIPHWYKQREIIWRNENQKSNLLERICNNHTSHNSTEEIQESVNITNNNGVINTVKHNGQLTLAKLFIYPIKSGAAYEINHSWALTKKGLQFDREWMVMTSAGVCLTQKQEVMLCKLKPTICLEENVLKIDYPGMPTAQVPLDYTTKMNVNGQMCRSRVCGHRVEGIDCGADINEWLSLALGRPNMRLIRQSTSGESLDKSAPSISFSSQAQYLLINEASIQWLGDHIPENSDCDKESILGRFRGNVIVRGGKAFEEDSWTEVQIGKNQFKVDGTCTRCQMICIDQNTGKKTVEPLRLLAEGFKGKLKFGIYLTRKLDEPSIISIGDPIYYSVGKQSRT